MSRFMSNCGLVAAVCFLSGSAAWAQISVLTERYDNSRTGANLSETQLTTANVSNINQFGKLFSLTVDGSIQAAPLYVPNVAVPGKGTHNVLYIATMNDKLYAFDADSDSGANSSPLWMRDFTNAAAGITPVPIVDIVGSNSLNIVGNVGILSTPVIDPATNTMYLLVRTKESGSYFQRLHAVDIRSGAEIVGSPATIRATAGSVTFDPRIENQRTSLALANGKVLIAWASHEDMNAYHGWVMAYDAATLAQAGVFCVTPTGTEGGIWHSGGAPPVDSSGNVYYISGNGSFNGTTEFGESFLKFNTAGGLTMTDWFTPANWATLNASDIDMGSAGPTLIPGTNLIMGGGKAAILFLLDTTNLGHMHAGNTGAVQQFALNGNGGKSGSIKGGIVYWDRPVASGGPRMFVWCIQDFLKSYHFNGSTFDTVPVSQSTFKNPTGDSTGVLTLSANGSAAGTGIVWSSMAFSANADHGVHPGILRAFDATDLTKELWNSRMNMARDDVGTWPKYSPPLVVNGKVYLGSFSNHVSVFGLLSSTPDFSVSALPAADTVTAGGTASYTVSVGSTAGFTGLVALTATGLPAGASATFTPATVAAPGSAALAIATSASTPAGNYTITVTGTSGTLVHSATVTLTVNPIVVDDFTLTATPSSQSLTAGGSTTYTATVTPVNGFSATVSLSVTGLPAGATGTFNPASISGASGTSVLTVSTASTTPPGTYTLTLAGTAGSLSHFATVTLIVNGTGPCVSTTAGKGWTNAPFASQAGTFTATYDATPSSAPTNEPIGLSNGPQTSNTGFAVVVSFSDTGHILALNGGSYTATNLIAYSAGVKYHFRLVVNVAAHTYSVFVTAPGGSEQTIATNFAFRTALAHVTALNSVGSEESAGFAGTFTYCSFTVN